MPAVGIPYAWKYDTTRPSTFRDGVRHPGRARCVQSNDVNDDWNNPKRRRERRRMIMRVVCIAIAVAMLLSLVIPAIYAGL